MFLEGYNNESPNYEVNAIDASVCQNTFCEECGAKMEYEPHTKYRDGVLVSYRAFCVCTNQDCGNSIEF